MDILEKCKEIAEGFPVVAEYINGLSVQDYLLIRQAAVEELKVDGNSTVHKPKVSAQKTEEEPVKQKKKTPIRVFREGEPDVPVKKAEQKQSSATEEPFGEDQSEDDEYALLRSIPDAWN